MRLSNSFFPQQLFTYYGAPDVPVNMVALYHRLDGERSMQHESKSLNYHNVCPTECGLKDIKKFENSKFKIYIVIEKLKLYKNFRLYKNMHQLKFPTRRYVATQRKCALFNGSGSFCLIQFNLFFFLVRFLFLLPRSSCPGFDGGGVQRVHLRSLRPPSRPRAGEAADSDEGQRNSRTGKTVLA